MKIIDTVKLRLVTRHDYKHLYKAEIPRFKSRWASSSVVDIIAALLGWNKVN